MYSHTNVHTLSVHTSLKNWEREFQKWLGSERISVFSVAADNKVEVHVVSLNMYILCHSLLCGGDILRSENICRMDICVQAL